MTCGHAKSRPGGRQSIPTLWLMTDERIGNPQLLGAIARLPRGSGIVFRHYSLAPGARRSLFVQVKRLALRRGLTLLLAGSPSQARCWGADGHHGRTRGASGLHSAPVHDHRERIATQRARADIIFLSPLFSTRSHPGVRPLGVFRFAALARAADVPVMALGGVRPRHAALVRRLGAAGYGAIDGLIR